MTANPQQQLLSWYHEVKRDLPWRQSRNPYHIWLSEIMLQQTRVETVKGYYQRFLSALPTIEALASAPQEEVLKLWEGLGYYSRARNLQKAAQMIMSQYDGVFPHTYDEILTLSGIGPYTAGAIASIAFGVVVPAIDGNVYRVASRYFGVREDIGAPRVQKEIRALLQSFLPSSEHIGDFNQALMELGASHCSPTNPDCHLCPWQGTCDAFDQGDAESLPIKMKKQKPKALDVAVCLLTYQDRVLVMKRSERLLQGLYVFALLEQETDPKSIEALLLEQDLSPTHPKSLATAKHVFTHRIWEMTIYHVPLTQSPSAQWLIDHDALMVTSDELQSLPLPTAIQVAKTHALLLLDHP